VIELHKALSDYLRDIGPHRVFTITVGSEDVFLQPFDKNPVLTQITHALCTIRPISLRQVLYLGGHALCEAGINVARFGTRGRTRVTLFAGETGVVYLLESAGPGFDFSDMCRKRRRGERYYQHKGTGFKRFERPNVAVAFDDNGRTVVIKATAEMATAYYEYLVNEPFDSLDGRSLQQAVNADDPQLRAKAEELLARMEESERTDRGERSPEWGYSGMVGELRARLSRQRT